MLKVSNVEETSEVGVRCVPQPRFSAGLEGAPSDSEQQVPSCPEVEVEVEVGVEVGVEVRVEEQCEFGGGQLVPDASSPHTYISAAGVRRCRDVMSRSCGCSVLPRLGPWPASLHIEPHCLQMPPFLARRGHLAM